MKAQDFLDSDRCDVGCVVRYKDGETAHVWIDGASWGEPPTLTGRCYFRRQGLWHGLVWLWADVVR